MDKIYPFVMYDLRIIHFVEIYHTCSTHFTENTLDLYYFSADCTINNYVLPI